MLHLALVCRQPVSLLMAFNCFFGVELTPEASFSAPMPPQTNLIVSQVSVAATATYRGRMSVSVETTKQNRIVVATLHPAAGVYHAPCQLLFSSSAKFFVEVDRSSASDAKNHGQPIAKKGDALGSSSTSLLAGCAVHATGYYERSDANVEGQFSDEDEEDDDGEEEEEEEEREAALRAKRSATARKASAGNAAGKKTEVRARGG
jgi:hypothetical protein